MSRPDRPARPAVLSRRLLPWGLLLALGAGCAGTTFTKDLEAVGRMLGFSSDEHRERLRTGQITFTPEQITHIAERLRGLEIVDDEPFPDFLPRARALLVTDDDPTLRALAFELPDEVGGKFNDAIRQAMPALVARWAMGFRRKQRQHTLNKILSERTVVPPGGDAYAQLPFRRVIDQVQAEGKLMDLVYDDVDHLALTFELEPTLPTELTAGGKGLFAPPPVILTHLDAPDVDPEGWTGEPYKALRDPGGFTAADATHGKGPLVAALWALGALKASTLWLERGGRVVVDTGHHAGGIGLAHYQKQRDLPDERLWSSGTLPPTYGARGQAGVRVRAPPLALDGPPPEGALVQLVAFATAAGPLDEVPAQASTRLAVVPGVDVDAVRLRLTTAVEAYAERLGPPASTGAPRAPPVRVVQEQGAGAAQFLLVAEGVGASASAPHEGRNAASMLLGILKELRVLPSPCVALMTTLDERLGRSTAADGLGVTDRDPMFGSSTATLTRVDHRAEGGCELHLDLRWPPPRPAAEVIDAVRNVLVRDLGAREAGPVAITVEGAGTDPWRVQPDQPLALAVREAWNTLVTGPSATRPTDASRERPPGAIGLGAVFAETPSRAGAMNERLSDDELERLIGLYAFAFARLGM
jgi:acetylornithine deacetylase/succinyl-diaminopimelate desuccinylase-like protein